MWYNLNGIILLIGRELNANQLSLGNYYKYSNCFTILYIVSQYVRTKNTNG